MLNVNGMYVFSLFSPNLFLLISPPLHQSPSMQFSLIIKPLKLSELPQVPWWSPSLVLSHMIPPFMSMLAVYLHVCRSPDKTDIGRTRSLRKERGVWL